MSDDDSGSIAALAGLGLLALLFLRRPTENAPWWSGGSGGSDPTAAPDPAFQTATSTTTGYGPPETTTSPDGGGSFVTALNNQRTITSPLDPRLSYDVLRAYEQEVGGTVVTRNTQGFGAPGIPGNLQVPVGAAFSFGGEGLRPNGLLTPQAAQERRAGLRTEAVGIMQDAVARSSYTATATQAIQRQAESQTQQGYGAPGLPAFQPPASAATSFGGNAPEERRAGLRTEAAWNAPQATAPPPRPPPTVAPTHPPPANPLSTLAQRGPTGLQRRASRFEEAA